MIARDRVGKFKRVVVASAAFGLVGGVVTLSQAQTTGRSAPKAGLPQAGKADTANQPTLKATALPVSPNSAVATINGEVITRQQLANECVSAKGEEILEAMIGRKIVEQAVKQHGMTVKAAEVDAEIDRVARTLAGMTRENWLRTLQKERKISPAQYAREIIYPALALRKLASPGVQVTPDDIAKGYEAQFGQKIRCRIIMTGSLEDAKGIWEELRKDTSKFEWLAQNDRRSIDQATRSLGGMLAEPISRHAAPVTVSDAVFQQLVDLPDGIKIKLPDGTTSVNKEEAKKYTPKDGDFTGPIQVSTSSYAILQRVSLLPAHQYNKTKELDEQMRSAIFEAKLNDRMREVYEDLLRTAKIDNVLTGRTNTVAHDEQPEPGTRIDPEVKLMSNPDAAMPRRDDVVQDAPGRRRVGPAPGVSKEDLKSAESLRK
ncbi:MAG: parvulin peptidyl-prolyl isomerase [Isosphaeraceae bacterium]